MMNSRFKIQDSRYCKGIKSFVSDYFNSRLIFSSVLLCLFIALVSSVNAEELPRGQVIPKVVCQSDAQKTYALYLPSYYAPEKKFPIIYAFEPAARGTYAVERFKAAAEKYGYIVVSSNDSRNGLPNEEINPIITAWLDDTTKRFKIDDNRVYLAGFSGGARLAIRLAIKGNGMFAGVIICGAGFPPEIQPTKGLPFVIFGTVGDEDFNYREMRPLDETLTKLDHTHRFVTFEGVHDWASSELCIKAIEWLELQAMKANRRAKDEAFVENLWQKSFEEANKAEKDGKIYEAFVLFDAIAQDFKGVKDVSEIEKKVSSLGENKTVKQFLKDDKEEIGKENSLTNQLISKGLQISQADSPDRPVMLQELRGIADGIRSRAQAKENTSDRRAARRSLRSAFAYFYEAADLRLMPQKKFDDAILYMKIVTEISPKNPYSFVHLARAYSITKQKKLAFEALRKAVDAGFKDLPWLEENKDFDNLRAESDWQKLVESIKQKASPKNT